MPSRRQENRRRKAQEWSVSSGDEAAAPAPAAAPVSRRRDRSAIAPPPSQNDAGETAADGNHGDTTPTRATRATNREGAVAIRHIAEGQGTGGFDRKLQRPNRDGSPPRTEVDDGAWDGIGDSSEDEIDNLAKVALEPEPDEMEATATAVEERLSFGGADAGASVLAGDAMDLGPPEQAAPPLLPVVPVPAAPPALDPFTAAPLAAQPVVLDVRAPLVRARVAEEEAQRAAAERANPMPQTLEAELDGGDFRIDDAWAPRADTLSLEASATSARRVFGVELRVLQAFAPENPPPMWATEPDFVEGGASRAARSAVDGPFNPRSLLAAAAFCRKPPRVVEWVARPGVSDGVSYFSELLNNRSRSVVMVAGKTSTAEIEGFRTVLVRSGVFHAGNMDPRPPLSEALVSVDDSARHAASSSARWARAADKQQRMERSHAAMRGETLSYDLRCGAEVTGRWYGPTKKDRYRQCKHKNVAEAKRCKKRHAPRGFGKEPQYWWNEEAAAWETYTEAKWNAFCQRCPRRAVPPAGDCICKTCGS